MLNFLFFTNLVADFFKWCLFNKNSRKSTENGFEHRDISETNNRIKLLIFADKSYFLISQPVPKQLILVTIEFFVTFSWSSLNNVN